MEKKGVPRGALDYHSTDGILALRWKDNKIVTVISSDAGVEPLKTVLRYDREQKKVKVTCPTVIKEYNGKMGGNDKSDMLTHLYKSPMRARRWSGKQQRARSGKQQRARLAEGQVRTAEGQVSRGSGQQKVRSGKQQRARLAEGQVRTAEGQVSRGSGQDSRGPGQQEKMAQVSGG
ncbi:hypothetical protein Pmani_003754 [Petrolisthes manimaculis]|uniref:PiggyBac transposable element-derived protein domain-containing protein n=1 Tax=Petrolisthes manimaculis TaxID=1843537 RepID=A0AAE1QFX0_9EUCA|nr:hypothetical protein Pmani_003754 [Petrolisthes manimaculis]